MKNKIIKFKRYCKTLTLKDDSELIEKYENIHDKDAVWPEVTEGMKEVGILDMEIYIHQNQLFMIMDTIMEFDHDKAMDKLSNLPRQKEWELYVSTYQVAEDAATAKGKWKLMELIFKMDQEESYQAIDGQIEKLKVNS